MSVLAPEIEYIGTSEDRESPATFWTGGFDYARYLRAEMPAAALGATIADPSTRPADPLALQRGPVAVWQRVGTLARANLIEQQKKQGVFTILEVDDDYTRMHRDHGWVERLTPNFPPDQACIELHRMVAGYVDRVIVSTPALAEVYSEFNQDVRVCRNAVNPAHWPERGSRDDGRLVVLWLSSSDHIDERMMASFALQPLRERTDVHVVWMGLEPFGADREWISYVPWTDSWTDWRKTAAALCPDVGIAPLNDARMNDFRSDIKALEYCALGALPVVQDAEPFRELGADVAIKCPPDRWRETLVWCADHHDEVRLRADLAASEVLSRRTIHQTVSEWESAIEIM